MQERAHMQLHNWLTTFKEGILKSQSQSLQDSRVRHQELKDDYLRLVFLLLTMACCEHCWPYKTAGSFSITKTHASRIHSFSLVPTWPFPMRTNSLYPLRFSIFCTCKLPTTEEWQRPSSGARTCKNHNIESICHCIGPPQPKLPHSLKTYLSTHRSTIFQWKSCTIFQISWHSSKMHLIQLHYCRDALLTGC